MAKASLKFGLDSRVLGLVWTNTKFVLLVCHHVMMIMKDLFPPFSPDNTAEVRAWECFPALRVCPLGFLLLEFTPPKLCCLCNLFIFLPVSSDYDFISQNAILLHVF